MATSHATDLQRIDVSISLPRASLDHIDTAAKEEGLSRSEFIRRMIQEWIEEEKRDLALADEAMRRLQDSEDEAVPWEQAKAELGL